MNYDFGIFVFGDDDRLESRGEIRTVARDNVLFEFGLFVDNSRGSVRSSSALPRCPFQRIWPELKPQRTIPPYQTWPQHWDQRARVYEER